MGSAHVLQAAVEGKTVRGVVAVTTDKVYRNRETLQGYLEDDPLGGFDPYSYSKAANEHVIGAWQNLAKIMGSDAKIVSARAGNVIGGGDVAPDRLMPDIVRAFQSKNQIMVRNPDSVRPWQHVLDPLFGYLSVGSKILRGQRISKAYNFGPSDSSKLSVMEIVKEACRIWPDNAGWIIKNNRDEYHEASLLWLSSGLAERELGWRNKLDSLEAVRWSLDWELESLEYSPLEAMDRQILAFGQRSQ
jgi:CDP-glucose 4,6-dehydratase